MFADKCRFVRLVPTKSRIIPMTVRFASSSDPLTIMNRYWLLFIQLVFGEPRSL